MKPLIISFLFLILLGIYAYAQDVITLSSPHAGGVVKACGGFILQPGFSFSTSSSNSFSLQFDCSMFTSYPVPVNFSANKNYILSVTPQAATDYVTITGSQIVVQGGAPAIVIHYFDGLGRPLQTVDVAASPDKKDVVTPFEYDAFGREAKSYLPYKATTNDGSYKAGDKTAQQTFYNSFSVSDEKAWSEVYFESSPLNRVLREIGPGKDWHGTSNDWKLSNANSKYRSINYKTNTAAEVVRLWTATDTPTQQVSSSGNYNSGTLYATETTDEDGRKLVEYTDFQGRTVRQQQWISGSDYAITDFVYDDFGRLRYVLPSAIAKNANKTITVSTSTSYNSSSEFAMKVYAYIYDARGRVVEKHIPGAGWTLIIYNKLDQPILTQDADQYTRKEWIFTKYDVHGRIAVTGLYTNTSQTTRTAVQTLADGVSVLWETRASNSEWTTVAFPNSGTITILSTNYYDNYDFPNKESYNGTGVDSRVHGLLTGSKVRVLDATPYDVVTSIYYDSKGLVIHSIANQPKVESAAVKDETTNIYNFSGQLLTTTRKHSKGGAVMFTLTTTNTYDHAGRLITVHQNLGNSNVTVADHTYNSLGQLEKTKLHTIIGVPLETIVYAYNIRGWFTKISSDKFREILHYQDVVSSIANAKQWGGNISAAEWKAKPMDEYWHAYKYEYDNLSRLTAGTYTRSSTTSDVTITYGTYTGRYNENYVYNNMGNMTALNRYHGNASTKTDALEYTYTYGNQVSKIVDSGTSIGFANGTANYTYNVAGRLITDSQKGITAIAYNHLGLPAKIEKGSLATDHLKYTYDAAGRKVRKQLGSKTARYYIDGVEYEGANLQFVATPFGRIRKAGADWIYDYFLKDHLGNVRVVLEAGSVSQSSSSSSGSSNVVTYLASMEEDRAAEENLYFENVDATRADRPFNYPDVNLANAKVSKVPGHSEGLKLSLQVMAGDTIEISAKAFYNIDNNFPGNSMNIAPIVGGILAGMTNSVITVTGESSQLVNNLGTKAGNSIMLSNLPNDDQNNKTVQPKSGLNFVLYNSRFDVVDENTGYLPVDDNINVVQNLASDKLVMTEAGFLEIFVNNDAQTPVYYDNMMVTMSSSSVTEVNAYYPYGYIITDLSTPNASQGIINAYKYNNKELQTDHDLHWLDYGARMYDSRGRAGWWTPDPLAEKYYSVSPYVYCANNPINAIDPDGRFVWFIPLIKGAVGAVIDASAQVTVSMANGQSFGQSLSNIDYTSVVASGVTSALLVPGMSTTAKVVTTSVIAADAMIDASNNRGIETTITGEKSVTNAVVDAAASVLPGKVVDGVTSGFNKAISGDLSSNTAAILTNETKSTMQQVQSAINSTGVQTGANATAEYTGKTVGGQSNNMLGTSGSGGGSNQGSFAPPDATQIKKPILLELELLKK